MKLWMKIRRNKLQLIRMILENCKQTKKLKPKLRPTRSLKKNKNRKQTWKEARMKKTPMKIKRRKKRKSYRTTTLIGTQFSLKI